MDVTPNPEPTPELVAAAPPQSLGNWLRANATGLVTVVAVVGAVCYFLHPLDAFLAGFGMSLIIFLHELGHFAAAKLCDVHVTTFSIGFGPAVPFCQVKYGETTYKLAMIPLGGFVAMVGEGDEGGDLTSDDPEPPTAPDPNPRSFKNKPVWQRMVIISAGVVMNIILAAILFVAVYLHGVDEKPAVIGRVEPGSAAWRAGIHVGSEITRINASQNPYFDDLIPKVSSTSRGETVSLDILYQGRHTEMAVEPLRVAGALYPQLGVGPSDRLVLRSFKRDPTPPCVPGSPAMDAKAAGGAGFLPGDTLVAMTDPADPAQVTPFDPTPDSLPGAYFDYTRRLLKLAAKPVVIRVERKHEAGQTGETVDIPVAPRFRQDLGLRMRMGAVVALRKDSPAERAEVQVRDTQGDTVLNPGDQIVSVQVLDSDGRSTRYTADPAELTAAANGVKSVWLDPLRLPWELNAWAERAGGKGVVKLTVLREANHTPQRKTLELAWDDSYRYEPPAQGNASSPVAVNGLGLAYQVQSVVGRVEPGGPAAAAGVQANDKITQVRFKIPDGKGGEKERSWDELKPNQWGFADSVLQDLAPHKLGLKLERDGQTVEVELAAKPDPTWGVPDRGLLLSYDMRVQRAETVGDALLMGLHRTGRQITRTYQGLYAVVFGRVSPTTMAGPITLARSSYLIAGEDVWHLMLWMALISVNLAVVNFLPIPVLDGGHMVFLAYEGVRGKPAPVSVQMILTYAGLAMILGLMLFVIGLDVWRLFA